MKKLVFLAMVFTLSGCASDFLNKPWGSPPGEPKPVFDFGGMRAIEQTTSGTKGTFIQGYGAFTTESQKLAREQEKTKEYEAKYCAGKKLEVTSKRFDFKESGYLYDFECK